MTPEGRPHGSPAPQCLIDVPVAEKKERDERDENRGGMRIPERDPKEHP